MPAPIAEPKSRRSLFRLAVLCLLDGNPRWWALARLWAVVAGVMLLVVLVTAARREVGSNWTTMYVQQADGTWASGEFRFGHRAVLSFHHQFKLEKGMGWRVLSVTPILVTNDSGPVPPLGMTQAQLDAIVHDSLQEDLQSHYAFINDMAAINEAIQLMLDGKTLAIKGWFYVPRLVLKYAGFLLLFLAGVVGGVRVLLLRGHRERLASLAKGLCPACGYTLAGLVPIRCPECGLDLHRDQAESRREIGE